MNNKSRYLKKETLAKNLLHICGRSINPEFLNNS